jgi:hypothetical protein
MASWLDALAVESPCRESWDAMAGDGAVRFCARCAKHVYDLSALTRDEADALIAQTEGELCARFARRPDGTVVTRECPPARDLVPAARARERRWLVLGGAVLSVQLASSAAAADASVRAADASVRDAAAAANAKPPRAARRLPVHAPDELVEHVPQAPPEAPSHVVMGAIDRRAFRPPVETLTACANAALAATPPDVAARIVVQLTIRGGKVEHAEIVQSTVADPAAARCVLDAARTWHFPVADGSIVVTYPLLFTSR